MSVEVKKSWWYKRKKQIRKVIVSVIVLLIGLAADFLFDLTNYVVTDATQKNIVDYIVSVLF